MAQIMFIVENDALTVKPSVLRVSKSQDTINFAVKNGSSGNSALTIQFKGLSPIDPAYLVNPSSANDFHVRTDAASGSYSYAVAVLAEGKIYLDAATPSIIIDRP